MRHRLAATQLAVTQRSKKRFGVFQFTPWSTLGIWSLLAVLSLGATRTHAEDSAQSAEVSALAVRARWASMQVLQALAEARMAHREDRVRCLDRNLTQINSVLRALQSPLPSMPLSHMSERVTFLVLQARTCSGNTLDGVIADGRTQVVVLVNPSPSGEPKSLDEIRKNTR
jgi:hypothetical protein